MTFRTVVFLCGVLLTIGAPFTSDARTVVRSGESVSIQAEQVVEGDLYTLANITALSGEVTEDAVVIAGRAVVEGTVGGDALVIGGSVLVDATVTDDVRVLAGDVTLDGQIGGDVVVLGGDVRILSTAVITGDVLVFAGSVEVAGEVGGDVLGSAEQIRIDGLITGDVAVTVGALTFGDHSVVLGGVRYTSGQLLVRAPNAVVEGELIRTDQTSEPLASMGDVRTVFIPALLLLFAALVWYMLSQRTLGITMRAAVAEPLQALLIGFGVFFLTLVIGVVLMATVIGSLVGMAVLLAYLLLLVLALIASGPIVGHAIATQLTKQRIAVLWQIAGGTLVFSLGWFVPFVGAVWGLLVWWLALGVIVRGLARQR